MSCPGFASFFSGEDGKFYWAFTVYKKGKMEGSTNEQKLGQSKKIAKDQAKLLAQAFESIGWSWQYADNDCKKFLPGCKIPKAIMTLIHDATESQEKLCKEAMALIKSWPSNKTSDPQLADLKRGHATCQLNVARLTHMKEFQELPDGLPSTKDNLDKIMREMAEHVGTYNELVHMTRGRLKALTN